MAQMLTPGQQIEGVRVHSHLAEGAKAVSYLGEEDRGGVRIVKQFHSPAPRLKWFPEFVEHQRRTHAILAASTAPERFVTMDRQAVRAPYGLLQIYPFHHDSIGLDEFLHGGSLNDADPSRARTLAVIARVIVASVARMHDSGLAHLDLKPANVLLRRNARLKGGREVLLIDFDFAVHRDSPPPWPRAWGFVGTLGYQSPEHFVAEAIPGPYSDVFTLGLMLFELIGEGRPWSEAQDESAYRDCVRNAHRPKFAVRPGLEGVFDVELVAGALASALDPDPTARPTAAELHACLCGKSIGGLSVTAGKTWVPMRPPAPPLAPPLAPVLALEAGTVPMSAAVHQVEPAQSPATTMAPEPAPDAPLQTPLGPAVVSERDSEPVHGMVAVPAHQPAARSEAQPSPAPVMAAAAHADPSIAPAPGLPAKSRSNPHRDSIDRGNPESSAALAWKSDVVLEGSCGSRIGVGLLMVFGRSRLLAAGFRGARALSREQFRFARHPDGWRMMEVCYGANPNVCLNGQPVVQGRPSRVGIGDRIVVSAVSGEETCTLTVIE
jgi:hypothetical protein